MALGIFKAVVLDYDGTLFDTRPAIINCLRHAFRDCGRNVPAFGALTAAVTTGLPLPETLLSLEPRLRNDRTALNELIAAYRKLYCDEGRQRLCPFPGAAQALRQLRRSGAKCIVVSNKGIEAIRRSLDDAGLSPFIDFVIGDEPGMPNKPDPAIVTDVILPRYSQLQHNEILMVGDTEIDILFARRARIPCCWASYGYGEAGRCRKLAPDYQIASMSELPALVLTKPLPLRGDGQRAPA
jgi:phosphoglycolate phosphatase